MLKKKRMGTSGVPAFIQGVPAAGLILINSCDFDAWHAARLTWHDAQMENSVQITTILLIGYLVSGIALLSIIRLPPTAGDKAGFDPP